jgi:NAD(P)-dependent dehydrogenase (short-subunit alcohol dehydrogenase family)
VGESTTTSRRAIVTGSESGIGKATAIRLAADGLDVGVTWHMDEERARDTARQVEDHGRRAAVAQIDVTRFGEAAATIESLSAELGGVDVLVNSAGGVHSHPFLEFPLAEWQAVLDLNLTGAFVCAQAAARLMVEAGNGGRIVNVTSVHEHVPLRNGAAYCASKGGLGLLTKVMALELAEYGINVNAVAPGEIATRLSGNEGVDPATVDRPKLPAGRPGGPEEIAAAIAFLASPDASYATGTSLVVDGGLLQTASAI